MERRNFFMIGFGVVDRKPRTDPGGGVQMIGPDTRRVSCLKAKKAEIAVRPGWAEPGRCLSTILRRIPPPELGDPCENITLTQ